MRSWWKILTWQRELEITTTVNLIDAVHHTNISYSGDAIITATFHTVHAHGQKIWVLKNAACTSFSRFKIFKILYFVMYSSWTSSCLIVPWVWIYPVETLKFHGFQSLSRANIGKNVVWTSDFYLSFSSKRCCSILKFGSEFPENFQRIEIGDSLLHLVLLSYCININISRAEIQFFKSFFFKSLDKCCVHLAFKATDLPD